MLQATLEIEFLHQTLSAFISTKAEGLLKQVYETISQKYQREGREDKDQLNAELERVKQILVQSRKQQRWSSCASESHARAVVGGRAVRRRKVEHEPEIL